MSLLVLWATPLLATAAGADQNELGSPRTPGAGQIPHEFGPCDGAKRDLLTSAALIGCVLQRNPGLSAMHSAAEAARAKVYPAGALEDPVLTLGMAPATVASQHMSVREFAQLSQAIPWPGTLRLERGAAKAMADSAAQQTEDLRLRLTAEARSAYARWDYVFRAIAINDQNQALLKHLAQVAQAAYASGQAPQQNVLQAEVERTRLQNQALELERRRRQVQAAINALLNREPDAPLSPPAGLPAAHALPSFGALRAAALARYPRLNQLDAEITAERDRVALAHKKYYPNFNLLAGYNGVMDPAEKRWTVGVAINLPFDFKKRNAWADQANAELHQSVSKLQDARVRLLGELQQAYAAARQSQDTVQLYDDRLLRLSRLNVEAAEADYGNGSGSFLDLITAQQRELMAELERASARATWFTHLADLDYQTGGALFRAALPAAGEVRP